MATASVYVKGKYDGRAFKSAKTDLKSIATLIKGMAVVKVAQQLNKIADATKGVFIAQNNALQKFNVAASKTTIQMSKLNNLKNKLSHGNLIDDEIINNAMSLGIQMGLTEEQLNKVMTAATELSSAGVMPLEQAVKTLGQTYSGTTGQLSKIIPEVKDLTKAQMEQGEVLDIVLDRYSGYAESLEKTFGGRSQQWNNSIDDLKAAVGSIPVSLEFLAQGKLLEPLNKITEWITSNRDYILNFILKLPQIVSIAFKGMFNIDFFSNLASNLSTAIKESIKNSVNYSLTLIDTVLQSIGNGLYAIFEDTKLGELIKNVLSGNGGKDQIDRQKKANEILKNNGISAIQSLSLSDEQLAAMGLERVGGKRSNTFAVKREQVDYGTKAIIDNLSKLKDTSVQTAKQWKDILGGFWNNLGDALEDNGTLAEIQKLLESDLPQDLKIALENISISPTTIDTNETNNTKNKKQEESKLYSMFGEIGSYLQTYFHKDENGNIGGWKAVLLMLLQKITDVIISASDIITNVLNSVSYFLNQVLPPVIKMIENWLSPILVFMRQIGEILRVVLNMLEPFFSAIGGNMLKVLMSTIITILDIIYNGIVAIHNIFTKKSKDWDYRDIVGDNQEIWDASSAFNSTLPLTSSNASSSYQAARDIYVTIQFNDSFVNGDADAIALHLRDRIREAERMGY